MGQFVSKATKVELPTDLPPLGTAITEQPDGAIFASDNGKRYRLHHPRWTEVLPRKGGKQKRTT